MNKLTVSEDIAKKYPVFAERIGETIEVSELQRAESDSRFASREAKRKAKNGVVENSVENSVEKNIESPETKAAAAPGKVAKPARVSKPRASKKK